MRGVVDQKLRSRAVALRIQQRLSLGEIARATGAPRGSLSAWLKDYPLTKEEYHAKICSAPRYATPKKDRGQPSAAYLALGGRRLTPVGKGQIAEAAVLFRLILHGFHVMGPVFDCAKTDWLVEVPETCKLLRLQVKWATEGRHGLPVVHLSCSDGHNGKRRYREGEFDFIVGYDLFTDTAYVYRFSELDSHLAAVTISPDAAECWGKLRE
jgi:hypothetical protein